MAISPRTVRLAGASLVAVVLVGGAYVLGGPNPFTTSAANAATTQQILQAYAQQDSDHDGLPDWEEALYGTDPHNPHSVSPTLTDGQAVAQGLVKPKFSSQATTTLSTSLDQVPNPASDTLTDQFARQLFSQYLTQTDPTNPPSADQVAQFVQSAVDDLVQSHKVADAYAASDIVPASGAGPSALMAYAVAFENAFAANTVSSAGDPLSYEYDGVTQNNPADFTELTRMSTAYANIARALIKVPVPTEAAAAHLETVNALMHLSEVCADMAALPKDPLRAELGIGLYQSYGTNLSHGFNDLYQVFRAEQVNIPLNQPGGQFYDTMRLAAGLTPSS